MSFGKQKDTEDQVVFYLKGLELERVRCIVGFVEQTMAPKVKVLTRKNKDKSQGKTSKKNKWSEDETFTFATVLS